MKKVNRGTIIDMLWCTRLGNAVATVLPVQNKNFSRDAEEPDEVPGADEETKSHLHLTIPWNLAKLVKIFPGIIVRERHTDRKQMGLPQEQCAEWRKGHMRYCCNHVWTKNGGRIPWNATAFCEMFNISCLMGRHHMRGGSGHHLTDQ